MIDKTVHGRVLSFVRQLNALVTHGIVDLVPAYATVTIHYDPSSWTHEALAAELRRLLDAAVTPDADDTGRDVVIPVRYGGKFGPDLDFVASHNGMTADEVVRLHSSASYLVYMIGFAPGFPYLGGLPDALATPRLQEPRALVPVGSVGIAGTQTGVYPIATPGGWRIIGRTPMRLFDPTADDPSLLHAGDRVSFEPLERRA